MVKKDTIVQSVARLLQPKFVLNMQKEIVCIWMNNDIHRLSDLARGAPSVKQESIT